MSRIRADFVLTVSAWAGRRADSASAPVAAVAEAMNARLLIAPAMDLLLDYRSSRAMNRR